MLTYAYDAAGQLVERTNGAGERTRFTYDLLGNVVEQKASAIAPRDSPNQITAAFPMDALVNGASTSSVTGG